MSAEIGTYQNVTPSQIQYNQGGQGLSPETKGTLASGLMAGTLGGFWFAPTKLDGPYAILKMDNDSFQKTAKNFSKLTEDSTEKKAFVALQSLRENIDQQTDAAINTLFADKETLTQNEILQRINNKKINNIDDIEKYVTALNDNIKKMDLANIIQPTELENGIKPEHLTALDDLIPDNGSPKNLINFKNDFKNEFPVGKKVSLDEMITFINKHAEPLERKKEILSMYTRILNTADENGIIAKIDAQKAIKKFHTDDILDIAQHCFENFKSKLPKARLKGFAKWFGLGVAVSILSNSIMGILFKNKKN